MQLDGFQNLFAPETLSAALSTILKLGIGALCAGAIGYEREVHGRPAGLRTHLLVVIGVIMFTEISRAYQPDDGGRVASQVVTGIGFLGAGSILRLGAEVKGLTTAASIWAVAAIGMAVSQGGAFLWIAIVGTIATLFTLAVVDNIEKRLIPYAHPRNATIDLEEGADPFKVLREIEELGCKIATIHIRSSGETSQLELDLIHLDEKAIMKIAALEGVGRVVPSDIS